MSGRRPTMRDVAQHAGVSFKTVSRVVNGEHGVSPAVLARVQSAVAALGYEPDDRARRLRQGSTSTATIGFVLVDVANPFFSSLLRGIEDVARQRGYTVLSGSSDGVREREDVLVRSFVSRRVDGLIVVPSGPGSGALGPEADRGTPIVFVDLEIPEMAVDTVRSDHYGGAVAATRHLIDRGHRRIAFIGDDVSVFSARLRLDGFHAAMAAARLPVLDGFVHSASLTAEQWRQRVHELLEGPDVPTALFTAQNFATIGAARALHERGLQGSVAQVGFDDVEMADVVEPGISVVPQSPTELGRRAATMLFERIEGERMPPRHEVIRNPLVTRGSGEIPAPPS
jgi:LacI family transcriptional regulator